MALFSGETGCCRQISCPVMQHARIVVTEVCSVCIPAPMVNGIVMCLRAWTNKQFLKMVITGIDSSRGTAYSHSFFSLT